jgi:uncharacterized protein
MPESQAPPIRAQVVYALPGRAHLIEIQLPPGATVGGAIQASGILDAVPELKAGPLDVGIFGCSCALEDLVKDGDRVEIYRPLQADPKDARRQRAASKG